MTGRLSKRILTIGALIAVSIAALVVNLSLLDVITVGELRNTLGRSLLVVVVSTLALVIMAAILKNGRHRSDPPHEAKS